MKNHNRFGTVLILAVALAFLGFARADQPVSCLRQQFHDQVWLFHVTPDPVDVNLYEQKEVCTHSLPNKVQIIDRDYNFTMDQKDTWSIMVKPDFTVDAKFCKGGNTSFCEKEPVLGRWQTIYDQTLIVELENDLRFIGTFRYQIKKNVTHDTKKLQKAFNDVDDFMKAQFNSVCNQTMAGFVQNRTHQSTFQKHRVQCMYAHKDWDNMYDKQIVAAQQENGNGTMAMLQEGNSSSSETPQSLAEDLTLIETSHKSQNLIQLTQGTNNQAKTKSLTQNKNDKIIDQGQPGQIMSEQTHKARKQRTASIKQKKGNLYKSFQPTATSDKRIIEVADNFDKYHWRPNLCMLSTNHSRFNKTQCFSKEKLDMELDTKEKSDPSRITNKTLTQVLHQLESEDAVKNETSGKQQVLQKNPLSGTKKFGEKTEEFAIAAKRAQKFRNQYKIPDHIPDHEVPANFDLRNIGGYDFTGSLRDQGACGSCYTNSFIQAIEGRMKMKYAHQHIEQPDLSIQFIMTCNYLTEGCAGGWSIFDGYFAEQGGIPTEKCAPYTGKTKGIQCSDYAKCKPHTRLTNSYYVNGYNFDPTEMQIRKEILYNGPVTTEFKASDDDFQIYKSGIMVQKTREPEKDNSANYAQTSADNTNDELLQLKSSDKFIQEGLKIISDEPKKKLHAIAQTENGQNVKMAHQPLDHSIYIVGWGHDKEKDMPYWIIRNSYGDQWGMSGDFHVRRGQDDYGVESEITAFDVELAQNDEESAVKEENLVGTKGILQ